jgi:hypothetical protein
MMERRGLLPFWGSRLWYHRSQPFERQLWPIPRNTDSNPVTEAFGRIAISSQDTSLPISGDFPN